VISAPIYQLLTQLKTCNAKPPVYGNVGRSPDVHSCGLEHRGHCLFACKPDSRKIDLGDIEKDLRSLVQVRREAAEKKIRDVQVIGKKRPHLEPITAFSKDPVTDRISFMQDAKRLGLRAANPTFQELTPIDPEKPEIISSQFLFRHFR